MNEHTAESVPILQLGHPLLRQQAEPIADVGSDRTQALIDQLLTVVREANGVGIAAPQIGRSQQVLVVASRPNLRYPNAPTMEPIALINPRILSHSDEIVTGWEGCLSVPGMRGLVPRYRAIEVEYTGRDGQLHRQTFTDFVARIFQHECDHLTGKVFLDRVETTQDLMTEQEFHRQVIQQL